LLDLGRKFGVRDDRGTIIDLRLSGQDIAGHGGVLAAESKRMPQEARCRRHCHARTPPFHHRPRENVGAGEKIPQ
jgi:hypothetical protein